MTNYEADISKYTKMGYFFIGAIVGVILMVIFSILIIVNTPRYETSEYEGMTCINHQSGLTCNWDEWEKIE